MTKKDNGGNNTGCFAWLIRAKQSVNERWARARNAFRKKFARDNSKQLGAEDYVNETGRPDMMISKVAIIPDTEEKLVPELAIQDKAPVNVKVNSDGESDQVGMFLDDATNLENTDDASKDIVKDTTSMTPSVISLIAEAAVKESFTHIIDDINVERKMVTEDNSTSSLSSGAISDIANAAVQESMTNIIKAIKDEVNTVVQTTSVSSLKSGISGPAYTCESVHNLFEDVRDDSKAVIDEGSTGSLSSGAISLIAEAAVKESFTHIIDDINVERKMVTEDNSTSSLSSGAISDIANAAVQESMTNIIKAIKDEVNTVVQTTSVSSLKSGISGPAYTCESAHNLFEDVRDDSKAVIDEGSTGSLSSGAISLLAEAAVTASLTQIAKGEDDERKSAPRSVTEMYEYFNIDPKIGLLDAQTMAFHHARHE